MKEIVKQMHNPIHGNNHITKALQKIVIPYIFNYRKKDGCNN